MSEFKITSRSISPAASKAYSPRRKKKKKRRHKDIFDIPGVHKIVLSELAQKIIECVAGDHVTSENPWTFVRKELIQDNLELHEESSEFLPIRKEIMEFQSPQILMGYIPDETKDFDEFYICITEEATNRVNEIIQRIKQEQEERLINTINKSIKKWIPQGTEEQVNEAIIKNNRQLIEVEVETQYPIFSSKAEFQIVKAEERRDGYMELKCADEHLVNVHRKRISAYVQVAPQYVSTEVQTTCPYPTHSSTQYRYEVEYNEKLFQKYKKPIEDYTSENYESISDLLRVNGAINLYADDYASLIKDPKFTKASAVEEVKEYMSFMDVILCKGKMIADAVWHPMWTGVVAVAYADAAPNIYHSGPDLEDNVLKAVHGENPVLIWSCLDVLQPKLILETPREVHKLSFCKFDENLLIGGCKNGQIIIWDIRHKLNKVEELEILTNSQQKYRTYMNSLMDWMKNIYSLSLIRPTAISDLRYSHKGAVTGMIWLSPFYEFSKIGNLAEISEDGDFSMQFLTSSEDGTILIWDLLKKPTVQPGGFKPKKLRRLKKRPSALMMDISPYRALHLNLKPIYRVNVTKKENKNKMQAVSSCLANFCRIRYQEINPDKNKDHFLNKRILYKPILDRNSIQDLPKPEIHIGTMEGDYVNIKWEGQDFDSGEVVNSETGIIVSAAKYHDGPINTLQTEELSNVTLTVGGKIFALWREDFPNKPLIWRRNRHTMYTSGEWNIFQPYMFTNKIINGDVESWMLFNNSKYPLFSLTFSNKFLTASAIHPLKLKKTIYGAGDKQGAFRLFFMPEDTSTGAVETKNEKLKEFFDREVNRKKKFMAWQDAWNKKNEQLIKQREDEQKEITDKEEEARKAKETEQLEEKSVEKVVRKGPQPGKYIEWIKEQRRLEEEARIKATIISKKQLDTKELEKRRKPLQKLDEENERKKRKQKQRLKEGETIFKETVASLFPDVVKEKPPPPPDPYAGGEPIDERVACYKQYMEISEQAEQFIADHPFSYEFNWRTVLIGGRQRRKQCNEAITTRPRAGHEVAKSTTTSTRVSEAPVQQETGNATV